MRTLLCIILYFSYVFRTNLNAYVFDESVSCDSMLPRLDDVNGTYLTVGLTDSPYKVTVNALKYRRNRKLKVKLDGGEFNGFFLQAKPYDPRPEDDGDADTSYVGTFKGFPHYMMTMDCGRGPNFSVSNTIYYYNATHTKKSVEIPWVGPPEDVGSIEFVATFILGNHYWNPIKSTPLIFNEFPPSMTECGQSKSCYTYSRIPLGEKSNEYTLVATVINKEDVIFVIGGKVSGDTGYVGVGFTNSTMGFVDMCVCVKKDAKSARAAHYIREKGKTPQKFSEEFEDYETDIDGDFVWCRFRRPLKTGAAKAADLSYKMTQIFLWGPVEGSSFTPVFPKDNEILEVSEPWNHSRTINVNHYFGGSSAVQTSWAVMGIALLAALIHRLQL